MRLVVTGHVSIGLSFVGGGGAVRGLFLDRSVPVLCWSGWGLEGGR